MKDGVKVSDKEIDALAEQIIDEVERNATVEVIQNNTDIASTVVD